MCLLSDVLAFCVLAFLLCRYGLCLCHLESSLAACALYCSVTHNAISGDGADKLAAIVLKMPSMVDFGGILIKPLRDNSVTDLDLSKKGLGIPETLVLSGVLVGASSLVTLK